MITTADATAAPVAEAVPKSASPRWPQLIPIAKLVATVLVVLAIIWHQEDSLDSLRTDLLTEINRLEASVTAAINGVEITPRTDISDDPPQ